MVGYNELRHKMMALGYCTNDIPVGQLQSIPPAELSAFLEGYEYARYVSRCVDVRWIEKLVKMYNLLPLVHTAEVMTIASQKLEYPIMTDVYGEPLFHVDVVQWAYPGLTEHVEFRFSLP